jgi:hypothetical protein
MARVRGRFLNDVTNKEIPSGTVNGSNTSFTISFAPTSSDSLTLFIDGIAKELTTDYSISGTTITMVVAPVAGQALYATYQYKA